MLVLYEKPMTFAVSDPATNSMYKWKPAVGVTAFTTQQTDWARLTLGFQIPERAGEIEWGPTIELNKGTCYWVNPLILAGARGPVMGSRSRPEPLLLESFVEIGDVVAVAVEQQRRPALVGPINSSVAWLQRGCGTCGLTLAQKPYSAPATPPSSSSAAGR